jgi:hypothetical protein
VGGKSTAKQLTDYVSSYDQTFRSYGLFSRALSEINPKFVATTGSFGSSPGGGGRGGWPWASIPGRELFADMSVQQAYDWDETRAVKPLHNVALIDRLKSYHPDKPTWTILDNFFLKMSREAMQRNYALALTRGVDAIGTAWLAQPVGPFARPQTVQNQTELFAWIHRYGGAYARTRPDASIGVLYVHPQSLLRNVNTDAKASDDAVLKGSHEGKTTEALFLCHAAGWPARIVTSDELKRGLPSGMKTVLLVGLNTLDDSWHWFDGLEADLKKFAGAGGQFLLDDESVLPQGLTGQKLDLKVRAYISQGEGGTKGPSIDRTQFLLNRNADNILKLRAAMITVPAPVAASGEPTIWAVPHTYGRSSICHRRQSENRPGERRRPAPNRRFEMEHDPAHLRPAHPSENLA